MPSPFDLAAMMSAPASRSTDQEAQPAVVLDRDECSQLLFDRGVILEGEPQTVAGLFAADPEVPADVDPPFALGLQIGVGERAGDELGELLLRRQVALIDGHSCSFRWWMVGGLEQECFFKST